MTAASREPVKPRGDSIVTTDYQPGQVASITTELKALYADVYAEPPYYETESDVANFADRLAAQLRESSFFLVAAWDENRLAGYILRLCHRPSFSAVGQHVPVSRFWPAGARIHRAGGIRKRTARGGRVPAPRSSAGTA